MLSIRITSSSIIITATNPKENSRGKAKISSKCLSRILDAYHSCLRSYVEEPQLHKHKGAILEPDDWIMSTKTSFMATGSKDLADGYKKITIQIHNEQPENPNNTKSVAKDIYIYTRQFLEDASKQITSIQDESTG